MISARIDIRGDKELIAKLAELGKAARNKILRKGLRAGGKIIQAATEANAPVDTGKIKSSIKVRAAKMKSKNPAIGVSIGKKDFVGEAFYGAFLEYGTQNEDGTWRQKPVGFMRQAADSKGDEAKAAAIEVYRKEILKLGKA